MSPWQVVALVVIAFYLGVGLTVVLLGLLRANAEDEA